MVLTRIAALQRELAIFETKRAMLRRAHVALSTYSWYDGMEIDLAEVPAEINGNDPAVLCCNLFQCLPGAVPGTVVDENELPCIIRELLCYITEGLVHEGDICLFIVDGNDGRYFFHG